jgi:hypothetical protein
LGENNGERKKVRRDGFGQRIAGRISRSKTDRAHHLELVVGLVADLDFGNNNRIVYSHVSGG